MFALDPAFLNASGPLAEAPLCLARLQCDRRFPWLILIPRRAGAIELEDLAPADRVQLTAELVTAGRAVKAVGEALGRPVEKLNIGQLGNLTAQLHFHVVGRRRDDPLWPGPVWGRGEPAPYDAATLETARRAALAALGA